MTLFYPSQGLMNALIYLRPQYLRFKPRHPDWSVATTLKECMSRAFGSNISEDGDFKIGTVVADDGETTSMSSRNHCDTADGCSTEYDPCFCVRVKHMSIDRWADGHLATVVRKDDRKT